MLRAKRPSRQKWLECLVSRDVRKLVRDEDSYFQHCSVLYYSTASPLILQMTGSHNRQDEETRL